MPKARLRVSAPSPAVLHFLKSQSDGLLFFTSNPKPTYCFTDHAPRHLAWGISALRRAPKTTPSNIRTLSTSAPRQATVEQSSLSLEFLHPRASSTLPLKGTPRYTSNPTETLRSTQRYGSSYSHSWFPRVWPRRGRHPREDELTQHENADSSMFNIGRSVAGKASNEMKLRCTEFDENGNVTLVNGEFKKSELIARYGLLPRDLRKIDSSLLPNIVVRPSAILMNLLHLRVLIKYNRVLVFDAYGSTDSYTQSVFMYDLEGKLRQRDGSRQAGGLPYEFRAIEAVLISVTSALEGEFEGVREPVVRVLRELEEDIDRDKLRHLLIYSKKLGTFEQKAKLVRDAIDELLDADDDLAAMYLTEKAKGGQRGEDEHTEVEMLLESYHKVCDEIVQASGNLVSNIRNTEEIVKAILDANRNSLMLLDLKFSIGTLGIGSGAFIAALYGMNLKNFMEDSNLGFLGISAWSFVFAGIVCAYGLHKLRKVQRFSMWGEQGRASRGSWRRLEPGRGSMENDLVRGKEERVRLLTLEKRMLKAKAAVPPVPIVQVASPLPVSR